MKRFFASVCALVCIIFTACTDKEKSLIVGKWIDTTTEQIIEYTSDGYYYEYINESFTSDKTNYKINGDKITYYIENEPGSEFSVDYTLEGDTLIIGGKIEYTRLVIPEND